jgi:hypothetical protein
MAVKDGSVSITISVVANLRDGKFWDGHASYTHGDGGDRMNIRGESAMGAEQFGGVLLMVVGSMIQQALTEQGLLTVGTPAEAD